MTETWEVETEDGPMLMEADDSPFEGDPEYPDIDPEWLNEARADVAGEEFTRDVAERLVKRYHMVALAEAEAVQFIDHEIEKARAHLEALEARRAEIVKPYERRREWLDGNMPALEAWAREALDGQRERHVKLAYGTVSLTRARPVLAIEDEARAVAWARVHCPEAIKETVGKTPLYDHVKGSGEVPDGCAWECGPDKMSIKTL